MWRPASWRKPQAPSPETRNTQPEIRNLAAFYPERMASRILGMGDVVSFVEKAQKVVDEKEAEEMAKKMMSATFDFDDFLKQSNMVKQMGNMAGIVNFLFDPQPLPPASQNPKPCVVQPCHRDEQLVTCPHLFTMPRAFFFSAPWTRSRRRATYRTTLLRVDC